MNRTRLAVQTHLALESNPRFRLILYWKRLRIDSDVRRHYPPKDKVICVLKINSLSSVMSRRRFRTARLLAVVLVVLVWLVHSSSLVCDRPMAQHSLPNPTSCSVGMGEHGGDVPSFQRTAPYTNDLNF